MFYTNSQLTVSAATVGAGLVSGIFGRVLKWLPSSAAEIILGIAFGFVTRWHPSDRATVLASGLGLFLLMASSGFEAGEEVVSNHLRMGTRLAVMGGLFAAVITFVTAQLFGQDIKVSLLLGIAAAPTSVGVATRSFYQFGLLKTKVASLVLSVAVVDDLVGISMLLLGEAFIISSGVTQSLKVLLASTFPPAMLFILTKYFPAIAQRWSMRQGTYLVAVFLVGTAGIIFSGSIVVIGFTIGTAIAMSGASPSSLGIRAIWRSAEFISPVFFFLAGDSTYISKPDLTSLLTFTAIIVGVVISRMVLVFAGKRELTSKSLFFAALLPRGEVTLVVLLAGMAVHIVSQQTYLGGVGAVVATSIISPLMISLLRGGEGA